MEEYMFSIDISEYGRGVTSIDMDETDLKVDVKFNNSKSEPYMLDSMDSHVRFLAYLCRDKFDILHIKEDKLTLFGDVKLIPLNTRSENTLYRLHYDSIMVNWQDIGMLIARYFLPFHVPKITNQIYHLINKIDTKNLPMAQSKELVNNALW